MVDLDSAIKLRKGEDVSISEVIRDNEGGAIVSWLDNRNKENGLDVSVKPRMSEDDIIEAILVGSQPSGLTVHKIKRLPALPLSWEGQRMQLGLPTPW